jgi:hypothetical protein
MKSREFRLLCASGKWHLYAWLIGPLFQQSRFACIFSLSNLSKTLRYAILQELVDKQRYPLVNVYITNWKITMLFMGKST